MNKIKVSWAYENKDINRMNKDDNFTDRMDEKTYEFDKFNEKTFMEFVEQFYNIKPTKKKYEIIVLLVDMWHKNAPKEKLPYKGGCAISKNTFDATRLSIFEMAGRQLCRQVMETIKEEKLEE